MSNQENKYTSELRDVCTDVDSNLMSIGKEINSLMKLVNTLPADKRKDFTKHLELISGTLTQTLDRFKWINDNQEKFITSPDRQKAVVS